jgi:predicted nucleic acid-binding protein
MGRQPPRLPEERTRILDVREFLRKFTFVAIDTNVLIAFLADEPLAGRIAPIIDAVANKRTHQLAVSTLVFAECAVRPYKEGNWEALDKVKLTLQMPNLVLIPMDMTVAEEAAKIRAIYNLKMPDAIIIATAVVCKADVLLTNDHELPVVDELTIVKTEHLIVPKNLKSPHAKK